MNCTKAASPCVTVELPAFQQDAKSWQLQLQEAVTDIDELCVLLALNRHELPLSYVEKQAFKLKVPRSFVARMQKGNPQDPLLRQVLPIDDELQVVEGFNKDPLGENAVNPIPGLLHKYHGRVLLIVSGACSINCRYCFRREFPYEANNPGTLGWQQAIHYIKNHDTIEEVIFSGGDPLLANDKLLSHLTHAIADIAHVKRLRIHTRLPVTLPARVTSTLLQWLTATRLQPIMVIHCNHAQEINDEVKNALALLRAKGVVMLNQSVLLRGVNDSADDLVALSKALFEVGVLPYYCHQLDHVSGSQHFFVEKNKTQKIMKAVRERLPGYLVPAFVYEKSGALAKVPVNEDL